MINKDFKTFNRQKNLFSRKKARKKKFVVSGLTLLGLASTIGYLTLTNSDTNLESSLSLVQGELNHKQTNQDNDNSISENSGVLTLALELDQQASPNTELALNDSSKPSPPTTKPPIETAVAKLNWKKVKVTKGDNLALIFKKQGYSASDLHYLMKSGEDIKTLKNIRPGHFIEFSKQTDVNPDGQFHSLRYAFSPSETLSVTKTGDKQFTTEIEKKPITFKQRFATATISSSFYNAGIEAGLPDGVIMELAGVFEYDIDFALEIRKKDTFSVLYQEKYIDGIKSGYGAILSAEFSNQGDQYAAVRYTDKNNRTAYYTPEGKALRKSFLRAPLQFNYVSSNFNPKRFHPIQKRIKPHRGVDYRAATGTPVRASGDGRVIKAAYDRYNGNYVFIQHGNNIVTKYLHFSKRAVKKGQRVKQGQIVGYVGSTGMSQAPHLHYEFLVNGVHRNPRTVKLPHAAPVRKQELVRFKEHTKPLIGQLETERTNYLAKLNSNPETTKLKQ